MNSLDNVLAIILGGGAGKRLYPLTVERAKPAVPIAGKYRLIDIPISNCLYSGINRIAVLTQFNSVSLHRHIARTYVFDSFHKGWVQIWAAEQTPQSETWYQGSADAVRKQLLEIRSTNSKYALILAGDHLYRMDYAQYLHFHDKNKAEITVAVQPVSAAEAPRLGLLKRNRDYKIQSFVEKPQDPAVLENFVSRDDPDRPFLGSMGIYLFNIDVLFDLMENTTFDDFGGEIIPHAIHNNYSVYGYDFEGYWEDIGTIRSFYDTNLAITRADTPFIFHSPNQPIYTRARFLPPSVIENSHLHNVFMADGCRILDADIHDSIIGLRSRIRPGSKIEDTILMGADFYVPPPSLPASDIPIGIGPDCHIEGAIIDKNARIGPGVVIRSFPRGTEIDIEGEPWVVRDGIVVIQKNTILPPGKKIGPEF